ncbi:putative Speckle-type POZ protein-like [Hypsibius exemplaris]|uniref:Speckle-type POZ protein-like n=1 Tax=Hypsibius exemplaris TaxID=2072580 RepID=A0A1W0WG15_HYPEX|nr:putative Speckle-type POZ protein-like [Hypsibius exemplaris]
MEKFGENDSTVSVTMSAVSTGSLLTMKINWKIDYFSFRQHKTDAMYSPAIKAASLGAHDIEGDWSLVLIPKIMSKRDNEDKEKEFVSLHLRRETKSGDVPTRFTLRIMDDQKNCVYRRDCMKPVIFAPKNAGSAMWGWDRYVSHEDLFLAKNKYLTDDALIIEAQIQCLASTKTVEETSSANLSRDLDILAEDIGKVYLFSDFTDFTLIAKDGRRLRAHRCVISARSEVFRGMITHDTKESKEACCDIKDTDGETLHALLQYMYGCSLDGLSQAGLAEKLLVAADKYAVKGLVSACESHLIRQINAHNTARLLILADRHSALELKTALHKFAAHNMGDITTCGGLAELGEYKHGVLDDLVDYVGTHRTVEKGTPSKQAK